MKYVMLTQEQAQALFNTARDGGKSLEHGDTEPAYSALNTIADSLWLRAYENGIALEVRGHTDDDEEEEEED